MTDENVVAPAGKSRIGTIMFWTVFILLLAVIGFFTYRVWFFVNKIRSGEIVALPQFNTDLSLSDGGRDLGGLPYDRSFVETGMHPSLGNENDAKLTIVMFGDFDCAYSRQAAETIRLAMAQHGDQVKLIYRHYPLTEIHPHSLEAAVASECAFEQGKFWQYFDKLYFNQEAHRTADLFNIAKAIGMEDVQFEKCMAENRYLAAVNEDMALAKFLALRGTPTYFFNGIRVDGNMPGPVLEEVITRLTR